MPPIKLKCAQSFQPCPSPVNPRPPTHPSSSGRPWSVNENHVRRAKHYHSECYQPSFLFFYGGIWEIENQCTVHTNKKSERVQEVCTWVIECAPTCTSIYRVCSCVFHSSFSMQQLRGPVRPFYGATAEPACPFKPVDYNQSQTGLLSGNVSVL